MEWTQALRTAIDYMEAHLLEEISVEEIANAVHISPFYFQRGFSLLCGCTIGEYIRGRRLYMAALDLIAGEEKVVDLSLKYGWESPESFAKAFRRFHGMSPSEAREKRHGVRPFLPLKISLSVKGGTKMDFKIEKMDAFQIIGVSKRLGYDNSYEQIPKFWGDFCAADMERFCKALGGNCNLGKYGICTDSRAANFAYWIAGDYSGGAVPDGLEICTIPAHTWAKFTCTGPMPGALQSVNTQIFNEWLPGNDAWEVAESLNVEVYSMGDMDAADYHSEIWIPVKPRS